MRQSYRELTARVQFRLDAKLFAELEKQASQTGGSPGSIAKRALLRELESDTEAQLEGLRAVIADEAENLSALNIRVGALARMLVSINQNLRWALTALLIESGASEEAAKLHAAKLIRNVE